MKPNGRRSNDVVVTISAGGSCIPLVRSFDPDTTDVDTTPVQLPFGAGSSVTIGENDHARQQPGSRPWTFELQMLEGANGNPLGTPGETVDLVVS